MPSTPPSIYDEFFARAAGHGPFPFQRDFAGEGRSEWKNDGASGVVPSLVDVPTGLGKTAMAVLGWLWRRRFASDPVRQATPRRLAYCLPMRVLVEQTRDNAIRWLHNTGQLAGTVVFDLPLAGGERATDRHRVVEYAPPSLEESRAVQSDRVVVYVLMGGEDEPEWDIYPERDAIIIGTQDMLLSRALNRGYAASRARWPMHFGLLNTDCLWVFDEVQLMGSGLATTAQLEAFRRQLAGDNGPEDNGCKSVWMSATLRPDWLRTVDFKGRIDDQGRIDGKKTLSLSEADHKNDQVAARWNAKKPLSKARGEVDEPAALASEVRSAHKPGTRTIVVVNTVKRACALFDALSKAGPAAKAKGGKKERGAAVSPATAATPAAMPSAGPNLVLLHSRFRPPDRVKRVAEALADVDPNGGGGPGTIVVSTQVIEAGVDVSAATLFTELAPWASLVQRFGRCNRKGEENVNAAVHWIDLPTKDADAEKARFPYELPDLRAAAEQLKTLEDVGLGSLSSHRMSLNDKEVKALFPHAHTHVIRRKDLLDLFDTTPDLAGNDIDIDRYVREVEETDVRVFWRTWDDAMDGSPPPDDKKWRQAARDELCPAPASEFRTFAETHKAHIWRWDHLEGAWVRPDSIFPGQVYLVRADTQKNGTITTPGYDPQHGWGNDHDAQASNLGPIDAEPRGDDEYDDDGLSMTDQFESIAEHTDKVCDELGNILKQLDGFGAITLGAAARWHDWGKAHEKFQIKIDDGQELADRDADGKPRFRRKRDGEWASWAGRRDVAKAPGKRWSKQGELVDAGLWFPGGKVKDGFRTLFRHELASALAVLQRPHDSLKSLSDDDLNLIAYLIAAHHGKVRVSIRSMPNEIKPRTDAGAPQPQKRFARGVWDGDVLPSVDLGGGVIAPAVTLSLEPMELGLCEAEPFTGQPSWIERVLRLRDQFGPFRLAYLEAILRAADERASAAAAAKPAEVKDG